MSITPKFIINKNDSINPKLIYSIKKYFPTIWKNLSIKRKEYISILLRKNFEKGILQEIYRDNLTFEIFQVFFLFLLDSNNNEVIEEWQNTIFEDKFDSFFNYHIRGISNSKGIEYLENNMNYL